MGDEDQQLEDGQLFPEFDDVMGEDDEAVDDTAAEAVAEEKGVVDAADASAYVNNDASGMHKVAKNPVYPGIHSMAVLQFVVNKDVWEGLTPAEQKALEVWYSAAYDAMRREADLQDRDLVARDKADPDMQVIDWPIEERKKFRELAVAAWEDFGAQSELAKEALDAHLAYMKRIGLLD